jgi:hypothetical protein
MNLRMLALRSFVWRKLVILIRVGYRRKEALIRKTFIQLFCQTQTLAPLRVSIFLSTTKGYLVCPVTRHTGDCGIAGTRFYGWLERSRDGFLWSAGCCFLHCSHSDLDHHFDSERCWKARLFHSHSVLMCEICVQTLRHHHFCKDGWKRRFTVYFRARWGVGI